MRLSDHDLRQMDEGWLENLPEDRLRQVSTRILQDLKEARDRLNRTPDNSSRPPSSRAPWEKGQTKAKEEKEPAADKVEGEYETEMADEDGPSASECEPTQGGRNVEAKKMPGKQPGAKGFGRTQKFAVTGERTHRAKVCTACGDVLPGDAPARAADGVARLRHPTLAGVVRGSPGRRPQKTERIGGGVSQRLGGHPASSRRAESAVDQQPR
jgi:transposase